MTKNLPAAARSRATEAAGVPNASGARQAYVDVFRGLLIAHMALDHASLMFNAGRAAEELAAGPAPVFSGIFQFLTRFTGVPVAPGFFFMAGFMVALTSLTREARGVTHAEVTRRLLIRGFVLILVDALLMGLPRALMGFYSFMVLTSIGVAIIATALLRDVSSRVLVPLALGILLLHPLLDVSWLPVPLRAMLYEPVRTGAFRSLYPIVPWIGILLLGFVVGRDALTRERPAKFWAALAALSFAFFFAVRLYGGYGNAYAYSSVASVGFWEFAKYPPDLPFLAWSFGCIFLSLIVLSALTRNGTPALLRPLAIFGRVPFFFYIVHFYVLGIAAAILRTKFGLPTTYGIWLILLFVMIGPCAWYYRKKRQRPNWITRYI
ncbi:MAG TPA: heparan-alpha-glucosaminide N-acetyltransferase domain-containing protein [Steroidobacteraceae bacterium]|nr:heparan-alpha-glucosaminide N-acetyltransferase domain-containing protein [Steroidobacteraceae bacterium]